MSAKELDFDQLLDNKVISPELLKKLTKAPYSRKPGSYESISERYVELTIDDLRNLPMYSSKDQEGNDFFCDYLFQVEQYHLHKNESSGEISLVDTQEFKYPRYVCRIKIIED